MDYLEYSGAEDIIQTMREEMQTARPAKPAEFMVQFLQSNYIKRDNKRKSCEDAVKDDEEISTEEEELQSPVFLSSPESDSPEFNSTSPFERPNTYIVVPDSLKRRRRGAICCDVPSLSYRPERIQAPKSPETRACLKNTMDKNIMFTHLEQDQLSQIFDAMCEVKYNAGDIVFRQGDEGDNFYVVEKGECDVYAVKAGDSQHVAAYTAGSAFGELALIYDHPRTSTVKAQTDVVLWAIDRAAFRSIVMESNMKARKIYESFLEKFSITAHLTKVERATIADSLITEQYWDGEVIFNQGDAGNKFYIIVEGFVEVSLHGKIVGTLSPWQYFGEIALLTDRPRCASVIARGGTKCVCLNRGSFNRLMVNLRLLGTVQDVLRGNMEMYNLCRSA